MRFSAIMAIQKKFNIDMSQDKRMTCRIFVLGLLILSLTGAVFAQGQAKDVEQLDFANGLLERKFFSMAVDEYQKFITEFPDSDYLKEAHFGIAEGYFLREQYQMAQEAYQFYLEKYADNKGGVVLLRLGQSLYFQGLYKGAYNQLVLITLEEIAPNVAASVHFYLGLSEQKLERYKSATKHLKKIVEEIKDERYVDQSNLEIGNILTANGQYDQANLYFEQSIKESDSDKVKSFALFKQGEIGFLSGNYDLSIKKFERVIQEFSKENITRKALEYWILALFRQKNYEGSINTFLVHEALIKNPKKHVAIFLIVIDAYNELTRTEDAQTLLAECFAIKDLEKKDREKFLFKQVETFIRAGNYDGALSFIDENRDGLPENKEQVVFFKAESLYALKKYDEAVAYYKKMVEQYPDSVYYESSLMSLAYTLKETGKDKEAYQKFLEFSKGSFDSAERVKAHYNALMIAVSIKDFKNGMFLAEDYLTRYKKAAQREGVLFLLATMRAKQKDYPTAIKKFQSFVKNYPKSARFHEAQYYLAYNLQLAKKFDEALKEYQKIPNDETNKQWFLSSIKNQALIYISSGQESDAAGVMDTIITEFKGEGIDRNSYLWLAKHYVSEKRFEDVLRITDLAGSDDWSVEELSGLNYFKAESYHQLKDCQKAMEYYDKIMAIDQDNNYKTASFIQKADCLVNLENYDEAKIVLEKALVDYAEDNTVAMQARIGLGNCERAKGNLEEAVKYYMMVALLYDDREFVPEALFKSGKLFEDLKKGDDARKVYQEIIDRFKDHPLVTKAEERIKGLDAT